MGAKMKQHALISEPERAVGPLAITPVDPLFYLRGARARDIDAEFLLEESLRFLNFGANPQTSLSLEAMVHKKAPRLTPESFETALHEFCETQTHAIYRHVEQVYMRLGPKSKDGNGQGEYFGIPLNEPYIKAAVADKRLKAILVPHLLMGHLATDQSSILLFNKLGTAFRFVHRMLQDFHSGFNGFAKYLDREVSRNMVVDAPSRLTTTAWVGGSHTLTAPWHPNHEVVGLSEKIYSTLVLVTASGVVDDYHLTSADQRSLFSATEETLLLEAIVAKELEKLIVRRKGSKPAGPAPQHALQQWLDQIREIERYLIALEPSITRVPIVNPNIGHGAILSDVVWGFILCAYARLFLLHSILLGTVASIPFRQIYEGGASGVKRRVRKGTGKSDDGQRDPQYEFGLSVKGVVGIIGVSLWEYFTGSKTSHPFCESARRCAPSKSGWNAKDKWVGPDRLLTAPTSLLNLSNPLADNPQKGGPVHTFDQAFKVTFKTGFASEKTRRIVGLLTTPVEKSASLRPTPFQIHAAANYRRLPPKKTKETNAKWSERFTSDASNFADFPPHEEFQIPIEYNPPILDSFFTMGRPPLWVFNKWGLPADSALSFGSKLSCQLQFYVAAWLYRNFMLQANQPKDLKGITSEIKFTAGNIQYGGTFPPHKTHRDGYGVDWSLLGSPGQMWHTAIHWPRDCSTYEVKGLKRSLSFSERFFPQEKMLSESAQILKQSWVRSLERQSVPLEKRAAETARIEAQRERIRAWVEMAVPKGRHTPGRLIQALPTDVLIAQLRDTHNDRGDTHTPRARRVFREYLKSHVHNVQSRLQRNLHADDTFTDPDQVEARLDVLAAQFDDWPTFPAQSAHAAHHVGHLAVLLSMPIEIIWGAPIYHFRVLRAVLAQFCRYPKHPFVSDVPKKEENESEEDNEGEEARQPSQTFAKRGELGFGWPLPLPRLQFLPHDHHHHWHVNYWRTSRTAIPKYMKRHIHQQIETHRDFVDACFPLWVMLGVDFRPFEKYLEEYQLQLSNKQLSSKGKLGIASQKVAAQIPSLLDLLQSGHRAIEAQLPAEFLGRRKEFREDLVRAVTDQIDKIDSAHYMGSWPRPGSVLDDAIRDTEKIAIAIQQASRQIKSNELPPEILEAQREEAGERLRLLREADSAAPVLVGEPIDDDDDQSSETEGYQEQLNERSEVDAGPTESADSQ